MSTVHTPNGFQRAALATVQALGYANAYAARSGDHADGIRVCKFPNTANERWVPIRTQRELSAFSASLN